jgi:hypothetical protein
MDPWAEPPPVLADLLSDQTSKGKQFREHIRTYNNNLAFCSVGANYVKFTGHGPPAIVIQGAMYHLIGSLLSSTNTPRYAQLYFVDTNDQLTARCNVAPDSINKPILQSLLTEMHQYNPHIKQFQRAMELLQQHTHSRQDVPSAAVVIRSEEV